MDGILMTPGDIAREHVTTVGYSLSVLLSPVKWTLPPGRPAYEYINNGNVMTWKSYVQLDSVCISYDIAER